MVYALALLEPSSPSDLNFRASGDNIDAFCRREFVDKVEGFGEADAFPSDDAETRWIWPEFTRPFRFPAGGQPLCQAVSSDGQASA
ncbi:hypothetical protein FHS21_005587 [Phyllobacterium trifolii]|jgi:hypothetical protein|uniref:Uncharacterized protein n=1 Tax=Phyllobacterium trifolii TaxID=300193 RepID=A0A839UDN0_9HYPH|nr:hypothetical protein [Phyllobacterium trifolii]